MGRFGLVFSFWRGFCISGSIFFGVCKKCRVLGFVFGLV